MAPRRLVAIPLAACVVSLGLVAAPERARSLVRPCAGPYAYAGAVGRHAATGIAATLSALERPRLAPVGQVAAWVGVGGPGLGAGGTDAWIQAGLVAFGDGRTRIYHEVTRPGRRPVYTQVSAGVPVRAAHRFVVAQVRPERWVVAVDGRRVAGPVHLPGSGGWLPVATAESWVRGGRGCNRMAYRFDAVAVRRPRRPWSHLAAPTVLEHAGYAVVRRRADSFSVVSRLRASP